VCKCAKKHNAPHRGQHKETARVKAGKKERIILECGAKGNGTKFLY